MTMRLSSIISIVEKYRLIHLILGNIQYVSQISVSFDETLYILKDYFLIFY